MYIYSLCINFSSWLGLACIVLSLIFTVHSYVSANFKQIDYYYKSLFSLFSKTTGRVLSLMSWHVVRLC